MPKILGIDYGLVRIGLALSDETQTIAFGKETIQNDSKAIEKLKKIIHEENVESVVIGYPLNLKGEKTSQTLKVESFEQKLRSAFTPDELKRINILKWDERFTSKMAAVSMIESG